MISLSTCQYYIDARISPNYKTRHRDRAKDIQERRHRKTDIFVPNQQDDSKMTTKMIASTLFLHSISPQLLEDAIPDVNGVLEYVIAGEYEGTCAAGTDGRDTFVGFHDLGGRRST